MAGEDVFEHAGFDVVHARAAVGGRRSLVEGEQRSVRPRGQRPREGAVGLPSRQHVLLHRGEVGLLAYGGEHAATSQGARGTVAGS